VGHPPKADDPLSHTDMEGHFQSAPASGPCVNNNGDTCASSTTIEAEDGHAWITTRTEHHWEDDDGNAHTSISYTTVHVVDSETGGGGKYGIVSVDQHTTTFSGNDWKEGKIESVHDRRWEGKALDDNNHLGLQVATKMVGLPTITKAQEAAARSMLSRMPEETAKDYKEHPHYYHSVGAGALAIPTVVVAPVAGAIFGVYSGVEAIRDHIDDRHPLP
jgi:hypothetical protein